MLRVQAVSQGTPAAAWRLLVEPARWHEWAPHIRGAIGLGTPEIELRRRGFVLLVGVLPVPVQISAKRDGRSWEWIAPGAIRFRHSVEPDPEGCLITLELEAPRLIEPVLAATYGPMMRYVVKRLAERAAATPHT